MQYQWPGNVRELENTVHRAIILARGSVITPQHIIFTGAPLKSEEHVADGIEELISSGARLRDIVADVERQAIVAALRSAAGNRSQAAKQLGINRGLLYAKMRQYELASA
jgi:DNA-binding NtrC family response regulator